ncbi:hypothetical protein L1987_64189 [Smallanthus sonchifolius]|uniref:Uncharacterized protein n=1 Tax=Smallanthus sonchifolius TaxID=185202 RepID=A0ACB9CF85_9ASTR|nr:hypothetical protein L1987_64189 [Smallanthus sonchifolius]
MEDSGRKTVNIAVELVRKHVSIASRHSLLVCVVFVMIWLNRSFPVLFSFLICASPVIASTLVLLGTLLFYGHANAPEIQNQIHNLEIRAMGNTEIGEGRSYLVNNMNMSDNHKFGSWIKNCQKLKQEAKGEFESSETGNNKLKSRDGNKGWETGSDLGESSSPSASMADINSMLDELHPLSGSEVPFPHVSTDAASDHSLESGDYDHDDDYDDQDGIHVKYDGEESVITWTTDDQRNLMNLGTSELERNHFLENLVARKKALRNLRMLAEKNMVNISPDLHFNAPHISTARKNHFDLPFHIHENNLGFAHSVMIPRSNPFDLHPDPSGQKPDQVGPIFQSDSIPFQTNELLGPRRKSFDFGSSSLGPYSIPERISSDPKSTGSHHTSDISEYIIQRSQFSEDNGTVKPHQVAQGDDRINEVDISGENTGYEEKTSSKSSSSSFFDVTDDIYDGDDDNEEEEYRSVDSPMAQDSKELQIENSSVGYSVTGNTDGGLPQRLKSWLTGWKA